MENRKLDLPRHIFDLIESRVEAGEFGSPEAYVAELVERDRDDGERRLAELRERVQSAFDSGLSQRTFAERIAEGDKRARLRGLRDD